MNAKVIFLLAQGGLVGGYAADSVRVEDWGNMPAYITQEVVNEVVAGVRGMGFHCGTVTHLDTFSGNESVAGLGDGFVLSCDLGSERYELTHEGAQIWKIEHL